MTDDTSLRAWFLREVFPHEAMLMRLIRRHWRDPDETRDLRQEIYIRIYAAARIELPLQARPFLLTIARNHLMNAARRSQIVPIDYVTDLDTVSPEIDDITPDRYAMARDELRRVQTALEQLPPRRREIMRMRRIEGLSAKEVAMRMGITVSTVENQLQSATRALVDFMLGSGGKADRSSDSIDGNGKAER